MLTNGGYHKKIRWKVNGSRFEASSLSNYIGMTNDERLQKTPPKSATERTAVTRVIPVSGDQVAAPAGQDARFNEYVVPELEVLYRVAYSITRNKADAEDLVQDTLLRAYRAIERFDGRYPRAWLLTIMRNAQVNRVRRKRPELMHDPDETMSRMADESADAADAESQLMDQTLAAPIEVALNSLPEKFRSVVELVDINELSYKEAADALGIPVGTVMSRLHRARRNIRTHLESSLSEE